MKPKHVLIVGAILGAAWWYRSHRQQQEAAYNNPSSVMASRM
ncbi:hypothetical protein [Marinobacter sp. LN3S78]